jgi:hypothetical protein
VHNEFFKSRKESAHINSAKNSLRHDPKELEEIRKSLANSNFVMGHGQINSPILTTNKEFHHINNSAKSPHGRVIHRKRDYLKENLARLKHFGDGLKQGERKDLHESMMKSIY